MGTSERESDAYDRRGCGGGQKELEAQVIRTGLCTGCGACVNICPYQATYRDKTVTLHSCDLSRGRCYDFCPQTPIDREALAGNLAAGGEFTPELGAASGFFITRATDERVRRTAQHGGTVTALVVLGLREGLIDSAVLSGEGEGLLPRAVTVRDPEAAAALGKSHFVVSPAVGEFNRAVRTDCRRIGIVATPCQALALAKMSAQGVKAPESGVEKLRLVIGLFCGWALSWRELTALVKGKTPLDRVTGMDIPPSRYQNLEVHTRGGTVSVPLDEVTACVRTSCRSCGDMTAEFSDLSVGSARLPEGWEEARGWNQLIVRTERGAEIVALARRKGVLEFREVPAGNWERLKAASLAKKRAAERQYDLRGATQKGK
jgi:coenzyme F420 hydrogenase subunit beta